MFVGGGLKIIEFWWNIKGYKVTDGKFIPTSKNMITKNLFIDYNFYKIDDNNFIKKRR